MLVIHILNKISYLIMIFKPHIIIKDESNKWTGFTASARALVVQIQQVIL